MRNPPIDEPPGRRSFRTITVSANPARALRQGPGGEEIEHYVVARLQEDCLAHACADCKRAIWVNGRGLEADALHDMTVLCLDCYAIRCNAANSEAGS